MATSESGQFAKWKKESAVFRAKYSIPADSHGWTSKKELLGMVAADRQKDLLDCGFAVRKRKSSSFEDLG